MGTQTTGLTPVQLPFLHVSMRVHPSPSLHAMPLGLVGSEQRPVAVSHVPSRWHWSRAGQGVGSSPEHAPARQTSLRVHWLPSSQARPSGTTGSEQRPVAASQVPAS